VERRKRKLIVRKQARLDAIKIFDTIAIDTEVGAERLAEALEARYRQLLITGAALRIRREYGVDIRIALFRSWLIFFRVTETKVLILRVLHGSAHPKRNQAKVSKT
jgi:plasmid stabilization system protein ParE